MARRFEPLHDPLSSPRGLMRIFRAIIQALVLAVFHFQPETPTCRAVRPELICDQNPRGARLLANELAQEPLGGQFVAAALDQSIENEAILIDSPPKPKFPAVDRDGDLIKIPFVAELRSTTADLSGEVASEPFGPTPNRLMADDNAPRGKQIFDHPQAERKSEIQPDGLPYDFGGNPATSIEGISNSAHILYRARASVAAST